jgi:hypothetical protein
MKRNLLCITRYCCTLLGTLSVLVAVCASGTVRAQEATPVVQGEVLDTNGEGLIGAAVLLVNPKDSTIACHTVSDYSGHFAFHCKAAGEYWLQAHLLGYLTQGQTVVVPTEQMVIFKLPDDPKEIEQVRIGARRTGVKVSGDTIGYSVKAYTTGAEKTLGDLLARLPGLKVSQDGRVTAQGQQVEKILFNGRDLFGKNVGLATQNISSEVADTVRVVHGYSEYNLLDGFQNRDKTVIDVGVKEGMWNRVSGTVEAGGGYKSFYEGRGNAMFLGKTLMVSAIAAGNNTGESTFTVADYIALQGGIAGDDGVYTIKLSNSGFMGNLLFPPNDTYRLRNHMGSLNLTYNQEKRVKINVGGLFSQGDNASESSLLRQLISAQGGASPYFSRERSESSNIGGVALFGLTLNPTDEWLISYSGSGDLSRTYKHERIDDEVGGATVTTLQRFPDRPVSMLHRASITYRLGDHLLQAHGSYQFSESRPNIEIESDELNLPFSATRLQNGKYDLHQDLYKRTQDLQGELVGKFRIAEEQLLEVSVGDKYQYHRYVSALTGASNPQPHPADQIPLYNDARLYLHYSHAGISWRKTEGAFRATLGAKGLMLYHDLQDSHAIPTLQADASDNPKGYSLFVSPMVNLEYRFSNLHRLGISYSMDLENTGIRPLTSGYTAQSYRSFWWGGRGHRDWVYLKQRADLRYLLYNADRSVSINANARYSRKREYATSTTVRGISSISEPYRAPDGQELSAYAFLSKTFAAFWEISLNTSHSLDWAESRVNGLVQPRQSYEGSVEFGVTTSYKTPFNLTASAGGYHDCYVLNSGISRYTYGMAKGGVIFSKGSVKATLEGGYSQSALRGRGIRNVLLETEISYEFWNHLSLVLIGRNLLNLNSRQWSKVSVSDLYRTEYTYGTLPGHILLKLRWEFGNKTKDGVEIKVKRR